MENPHFTWMVQSITAPQLGEMVGLYLTPDDIHIMHKTKPEV